jgi:hypothetical protein
LGSVSGLSKVTFIAKEQHFSFCQLFGCAIQTNLTAGILHFTNAKKQKEDKTKNTRQDRAGQDRTKQQDKVRQDNAG